MLNVNHVGKHVLGSGCFGVLDGWNGWMLSIWITESIGNHCHWRLSVLFWRKALKTLRLKRSEGNRGVFVSTNMPLGLLTVPFSFCRVAARLPDVRIPTGKKELDILIANQWRKNSRG